MKFLCVASVEGNSITSVFLHIKMSNSCFIVLICCGNSFCSIKADNGQQDVIHRCADRNGQGTTYMEAGTGVAPTGSTEGGHDRKNH